MKAATTALLAASLAAAAPAKRQAVPSLHDLFVAKGKEYFGAITDPQLLNNAQDTAAIQASFGQVTCENSMKWDATEPNRGQFSLDGGQQVVDFAAQNNLLVRGHTLLWHSQHPSYVEAVTDPAELTAIIQEHVQGVAGGYAGSIYHWDVVNEIFNEDGTLRDSVFSRVLGEDFVKIAFDAAKEADPAAKLYINDYNLDDGSYGKVANGMAPKVKEWLAAGVPIDGIGSQSHLGSSAGTQSALEALANSGVAEVAVTELDIEGAAPNEYVGVVNACLAVEKCVGITVWGVSDANSWRAGSNPLLYDGSYQPKEAYNAIVEALQ